MRVVLSGPVTADVLERADMLGGITATQFVVNDKQEVLVESGKEPIRIPCDPMVPGDLGILQNDWRLVMKAHAVVIVGHNPHLERCAALYELPCYVE